MRGLCSECLGSNLEVTLSDKTGLPICMAKLCQEKHNS